MKKKIVISLCMVMAATAVLTSCKKDNDTVSFRATISTYQNNGKVYIDNNRFANWIDEDEVLINGAPYTVEVEGSGNSRIASINGVTAVTSGGYYAIYPAECALPTPTTGTIPTSGFPQILLPQVQLYRSTTIDGQTVQIVEAPMAAYCSADRQQAGLDFTNLCSLLKITLPSAMEVGYITVSSSTTPLWGKATISGTTTPTLSAPNISDMYSNDNTVTLDCTTLGLHNEGSGASIGTTSAGPFYIVLPPATNVSNLTVSIYVFTNSSTASRRTITKYTKSAPSNSNITIESNKIYNIGNLSDFQATTNAPDVPFPHLGTGEFSVSRTKKVRFALGNLQYQAKTGTWRFAEEQYDRIGNAAGNNVSIDNGRSTQEAWIDLFGFGTSGVNYNPWETSTNTTPNNNNPYARAHINGTVNDWGVNEISNGGNQPNKWRTLTEAEWQYLLGQEGSSRTNANDLHIPVVSIRIDNSNTIRGTMIFPDGHSGSRPDNRSTITLAQWRVYEAAGAVFLPVTGHRKGTAVTNLITTTTRPYQYATGYYWTSTFETTETGYTRGRYVKFDSQGDGFEYTYTYWGHAVRLARDVN